MKIEKLSSNKIRVTVTPSELTVWDINPQAISPDSPQLKEFIASLLAQSAEETGFDLASTSILVEARPQGNDFVFVITQLAYGIEETRKEFTRAIIRKKLLSGQYRAKSSSAPALSYFRFGALSDFAAFWRAAGPDGMDGAVLHEAEGAYILGLRARRRGSGCWRRSSPSRSGATGLSCICASMGAYLPGRRTSRRWRVVLNKEIKKPPGPAVFLCLCILFLINLFDMFCQYQIDILGK